MKAILMLKESGARTAYEVPDHHFNVALANGRLEEVPIGSAPVGGATGPGTGATSYLYRGTRAQFEFEFGLIETPGPDPEPKPKPVVPSGPSDRELLEEIHRGVAEILSTLKKSWFFR